MATAKSNSMELVTLKPSHFSEILSWDRQVSQSFFRFRNPLKLSSENLALMLADKNGYYRVGLDTTSDKPVCFLAFTGFQQVDARAMFSVGYSVELDPNFKMLGEAMTQFFLNGFQQLKLQKIQMFLLGLETQLEKLFIRMGAQKEGSLLEHFYFDGKYRNVLVYSLLAGELQ